MTNLFFRRRSYRSWTRQPERRAMAAGERPSALRRLPTFRSFLAVSLTPPRFEADDEHNVRRPTKAVSDGNGGVKLVPLDLGERLRYLELKTNAWMNWANHYDLDRLEDTTACKRHQRMTTAPRCGSCRPL